MFNPAGDGGLEPILTISRSSPVLVGSVQVAESIVEVLTSTKSLMSLTKLLKVCFSFYKNGVGYTVQYSTLWCGSYNKKIYIYMIRLPGSVL
jgi:hypothetical protein